MKELLASRHGIALLTVIFLFLSLTSGIGISSLIKNLYMWRIKKVRGTYKCKECHAEYPMVIR